MTGYLTSSFFAVKLSVLVVSRTPSLLSQMLASLAKATSLAYQEVEVLCSWNGELNSEKEISNASGYEFLVAQRIPYHFSSNMNALAERSQGELLLLINDDVLLDPGSVDAAIKCLIEEPMAGLVGGRLRDNCGQLTHAGIVFDHRHSPYHQFDGLIPANSPGVLGSNCVIPAVTGALMLIRRDHFLQIGFNQTYKVCGEDIELCLDLRSKLQLEVWYCPDASGIHESETTRKQFETQQGNSEDLTRMRTLHKKFIESANTSQLLNEWASCRRESNILRDLSNTWNNFAGDLEAKLEQADNKSHALQLARIRLQNEVDMLKRDLIASNYMNRFSNQ